MSGHCPAVMYVTSLEGAATYRPVPLYFNGIFLHREAPTFWRWGVLSGNRHLSRHTDRRVVDILRNELQQDGCLEIVTVQRVLGRAQSGRRNVRDGEFTVLVCSDTHHHQMKSRVVLHVLPALSSFLRLYDLNRGASIPVVQRYVSVHLYV